MNIFAIATHLGATLAALAIGWALGFGAGFAWLLAGGYIVREALNNHARFYELVAMCWARGWDARAQGFGPAVVALLGAIGWGIFG
jgi:hypothetical protein